MQQKPIPWSILLGAAIVKFVFHFFANPNYEFHRDELLFLAMGRHPDWGYISVPPFIGWLAWLVQNTLGDELWMVRMVPDIGGSILVVLTGLLARELGAGKFGQFFAAFCILYSPVFLRMSLLFQPVIWDVCFWTAVSLLIVRYLNQRNGQLLLVLGGVIGFSLLNKYTTGFYLLALLSALLFTYC